MAAGAEPAAAHGVVGKRFLPSTLVIEDPFANDELSLPIVSTIEEPATAEEPETRETEVEGEFSKRITEDLAVSVEGEWAHLNPEPAGESNKSGFGNLELAAKYVFFKDQPRETILSTGLGWEVGDTGSAKVEAEEFHSLLPNLFFGKGFGDLPDSLDLVKPLAVTGFVGAKVPLRGTTTKTKLEVDRHGEVEHAELEVERHPNLLKWGLVVEYSIPYLQSFVRDVGIPAPFDRMIPVVELDFSKKLDRGGGGIAGTVNPGFIWAGRTFQVGIEAIVPVNERSADSAGFRGQVHFFIDDLFPRTIGRPLFGT